MRTAHSRLLSMLPQPGGGTPPLRLLTLCVASRNSCLGLQRGAQPRQRLRGRNALAGRDVRAVQFRKLRQRGDDEGSEGGRMLTRVANQEELAQRRVGSQRLDAEEPLGRGDEVCGEVQLLQRLAAL